MYNFFILTKYKELHIQLASFFQYLRQKNIERVREIWYNKKMDNIKTFSENITDSLERPIKQKEENRHNILNHQEILNTLCEAFGDIYFQQTETKTNIKNKNGTEININKNFTYADIPILILKIQENHNQESETKIEITQNLAQKYRTESQYINQMIRQEEWNETKNETIRDAKSLWSEKAFFYFTLSLAYQGQEVFQNGKIKTDIVRPQYIQFLDTLPNTEIPQRYKIITQKIQKIQDTEQDACENFTQEILEIYGTDSDLFTFDDFNDIQQEFIRFIDEKIPENILIKSEKEELKIDIQNFDIAQTIKDIRENKKDESEIKNVLKEFGLLIDKKIQIIIEKKGIKWNRQELNSAEELFEQEVQETLENDLLNIIFKKGEEELWKEINTGPKNLKYYFKREHPSQWKKFEKSKEEYEEAKERNDIPTMTTIQKNRASDLYTIFHSRQIWNNHNSGTYKFENIKQRQINCMTEAQIVKMFWKEFFNKEILAATTGKHFFSIIPLEDGSFWELDYTKDRKASEINIENKEGIQYLEKYEWATIGKHEKIYQASVLDWIAKKNIGEGKTHLAIICLEKAIDLNPESPFYYDRIANILIKQNKTKEALVYIEKATKLAPQTIKFVDTYAEYLIKTNQQEKAIQKYKEIEKNDKDNANILIHIGLFYCHVMKDYHKALPYIEKGLEHYDPPKNTIDINIEHIKKIEAQLKNYVETLEKMLKEKEIKK